MFKNIEKTGLLSSQTEMCQHKANTDPFQAHVPKNKSTHKGFIFPNDSDIIADKHSTIKVIVEFQMKIKTIKLKSKRPEVLHHSGLVFMKRV